MKQHTFRRIETLSKKDRVVATLREAAHPPSLRNWLKLNWNFS